ncbi:ABC transporter permease [Halobaculum sp. MBLA0147]|uniref:ABC transporter permease n=1 Tax=Halobaculum sp. MBLA0147 TaxID=3079934 RepID=UPI003523DBED
MESRETLRIAGRSIRAHRLRSTLTVIGIVIGIASVVVFASFGASVEASVIDQIGQTNANNVYLLPAQTGEGGGPGGGLGAARPVFTERDVRELAALDGVAAVIPRGIVPVSSVAHENDTVAQRQLTATTPATFRESSIVAGRGFESGASEVVVNERAAAAFPGNLSVGDEVTIRLGDGERETATVVGIVSGTRGGFLTSFGDAQPRFYVPADPYYDTTVTSPSLGVDQRAYPQVTVVAEPQAVAAVRDRVEVYLSRESDAAQLLPRGFELSVQTSGDVVAEIQDVIDRITRFVTGIAVIALVVGAIGIANITLVSVTERTKEIGIMKAVGATNRDTMQLFLTEAVLLGALGAVVGVPLGLVVGFGAAEYADVAFTLPWDWIAFSVLMGVSTGVVAGLYPAWRASRVDPIEALRYE